MRVGVVDIGSNTARLLVADVGDDGSVTRVEEDRVYLRLGAEIERLGRLRRRKIEEAATTAAGFAARGADLGVERLGIFVTAPGRQGASGVALVDALRQATGVDVQPLSAAAEGRLAYDGAVSDARSVLRGVTAVVDVGGGSTEIVVGMPPLGAAWVRSIDLGSLRLTSAHLRDDPPTKTQIATARDAIREAVSGLDAPAPDLALAVGGSARAIAKVLGRRFDADDLDEAVQLLTRRPAAKVARSFGLDVQRAQTLPAGALLLAEAGRVLGTGFELGRGGLREGAARELALECAARAA